jgi:hypothetical protein
LWLIVGSLQGTLAHRTDAGGRPSIALLRVPTNRGIAQATLARNRRHQSPAPRELS